MLTDGVLEIAIFVLEQWVWLLRAFLEQISLKLAEWSGFKKMNAILRYIQNSIAKMSKEAMIT